MSPITLSHFPVGPYLGADTTNCPPHLSSPGLPGLGFLDPQVPPLLQVPYLSPSLEGSLAARVGLASWVLSDEK